VSVLQAGAENADFPTVFYRATLVTFSKLVLRYGGAADMDLVMGVFIKALKRSGPCDDLKFVFKLFARIVDQAFERACAICGADEVRESIFQQLYMPNVSVATDKPLRKVVERDDASRLLYYPTH
jgi:hypothetical protein